LWGAEAGSIGERRFLLRGGVFWARREHRSGEARFSFTPLAWA